MGKKKKSKSPMLNLLGTVNTAEESGKETNDEEKEKKKCILERRLEDRVIPKVDAGIRENDLKNPPPDVVEDWYAFAHVGKYVHMEQRTTDGVTYNTKRVQFEFARMLEGYDDNIDERGVNPVIEKLTFATLRKVSFINNIANPLRYINYFIEYFDDDDELMNAYFELMYYIMYDKADLTPDAFLEALYAAFATESMIDKVYRMVEYNTDESLVKKTDRTYDESIQLTVEHLKAIIGVSVLHKFIIPLISHYYDTRTKYLEEAGMSDKDLYCYAFMSLIDVFDDKYDISLYNKLFHTSTTRITKTTNQESQMWIRRIRLGETPVYEAVKLMKDYVTDISQKVLFAKSAIIFIHVCMDREIRNTLIQADKHEFSEMKQEASDSVNEKISRWDRWQSEKTFHSQNERIHSIVAIRDSLDRYGKKFGLDFKRMRSNRPKDIKATQRIREEFEFYRDNIQQPFNPTQVYLAQLYYCSLVGNLSDADALENQDIIQLIMIMKRDFRSRNYNYLPFFISGKVNSAVAKKNNKKRIEKMVMAHQIYEDWIKEYEFSLGYLNKDNVLGHILTIVSCPITIVDFEYPELCGATATPNDISVIDEVMRFMFSL